MATITTTTMTELRAKFEPGTRVRVDAREFAGHTRTPRYIRGLSGVVERVCGAFENPERLAAGAYGEPPIPLYRVRFRQADVWPGYVGGVDDTIDIEIYEHWLRESDGC
jgi:hypothetical protein